MNSIQIQGGVALQGKVRIQGSKNAALPILAATLLTKDTSCISSCPKIADVHRMVSLLRRLGCGVAWEKDGVRVNAGEIRTGEMLGEAITGMRSSLCLLGALLGRCREVVMEHPGGCVIGERPIDIHLLALSHMGVEFTEQEGKLRARAPQLHGACLQLPFPSVGATENILLAAVLAEGVTEINGAAMEPEIGELCRYLCCCGAEIEGIGTRRLKVYGGRKLKGADYRVCSDRIVAGTYLFACMGAGGSVFLEGAPAEQMAAALYTAEQMGGRVCVAAEGIYVQAPGRPKEIARIVTAPYPGFPTDLQSAALAVMTVCSGHCLIEEKIFENRFRVMKELNSMGAKIRLLDAGRVEISGVDRLKGAAVEAKELRGGAALVIAGLMAEGETRVCGCSYIDRGYENICKDLRELGARIVSV